MKEGSVMSRWRKATWAFVIWNLLMVLWTASFSSGVGDCAGETDWAWTVCETGRAIGTAMGVPIMIVVWSAGVIVFGLIWLMSRPKEGVGV
jgi:hypothetical protein